MSQGHLIAPQGRRHFRRRRRAASRTVL